MLMVSRRFTSRMVKTQFLIPLILPFAVLVLAPAHGFPAGRAEVPDSEAGQPDEDSTSELEPGTEVEPDQQEESELQADPDQQEDSRLQPDPGKQEESQLQQYPDLQADHEAGGERLTSGWFEDGPVALVLGGGGAWGAAHIGVIEVLEEENIPVDMIVGTSAGAVAGAFYLDGYSTEELSLELENLPFLEVLRPALGGIGFFSTEPLEEFFEERLDARRLEDFPTTLAVTATDINTGESLYFDEGPLTRLLTASMAVPVVFDPVEYEGRLLADGGIVDNVPVAAARALGAQTLIVVNVGGGFAFTGEPESRTEYANRIYNIMRKALHDAEEVDIYIDPDLDGISGTDFDAHAEITRRGREAAEKMLPELRELFHGP